METFLGILTIAFIVVVIVLSFQSAKKYRNIASEYWKEYWLEREDYLDINARYCCNWERKDEVERGIKRMQEQAQKSYEAYRERFANDYGKTIEEATECQAVKNYKEYLEQEHGVKIDEHNQFKDQVLKNGRWH